MNRFQEPDIPMRQPERDPEPREERVTYDPLRAETHAQQMLVEEIMALWGRSQRNPVQVRATLATKTLATLGEIRQLLLDGGMT